MKLVQKTGRKNAVRKVVYLILIACNSGCITSGAKLSGQTTIIKKTDQVVYSDIDPETYQVIFTHAPSGSRGHVTILK